MKKHIVTVNSRDISENLRIMRKTKVPGNIFQAGKKSISIKIDTKEFTRIFHEVGEASVVYLTLEKNEYPAMIEEVQWHPVTDLPIHVVFKVMNLKEKTIASIPVILIGELDIPQAVLVTVKDEIEVEALPTDLPEKFEINIAQLTEIGQSITLADLDFDREKVMLILGEEGEESPVVLVQEVQEEIEEEVKSVETEIIGEDEEKSEEENSKKEPNQSTDQDNPDDKQASK